MRSLKLMVYEHPSIAVGESKLFHRADDPGLPEELRACVSFPCIVTGDLDRFGETMTLLRVAELWGELPCHGRRKEKRG